MGVTLGAAVGLRRVGMRLFAGMVSICVVAMVASLAQAQSIRKGQAPRELHAHQAGYSVHAEPAMYGGDGCCGPTHQGCCCPILSTVVGGVKCVLNTIFPCHTGCGYASCGKCCLPSVRFHPPMSPCCNSYQGGVIGEEIMGPEMVVPSAPTTPSSTSTAAPPPSRTGPASSGTSSSPS